MRTCEQTNQGNTTESAKDVKPRLVQAARMAANEGQTEDEATKLLIDRHALCGLPKATLTFDFLENNASNHTVFAAIAELLDNSKDAESKQCEIELTNYKDKLNRTQPVFTVLDNGSGMDTKEVQEVIMFGKSKKTGYGTQIGMYGVGLKAGAMRIAKDMLVITKKHQLTTCLLLSRTFLETEGLQDVRVPVPAFDNKLVPILNDKSEELHQTEMQVIYCYSPYTNFEQLKKQFARIRDCGTLIILFQLVRSRSNPTAYQIDTVGDDIVLTNPDDDEDDGGLSFYRRSLKAYVSVLYHATVMKIFLNGHRVPMRRVELGLYKPHTYTLTFRSLSSVIKDEIKKMNDYITGKETIVHNLKASLIAAEKKMNLPECSVEEKERMKSVIPKLTKQCEAAYDGMLKDKAKLKDLEDQLKTPSELTVHVGLSIQNRGLESIYLYNNERLIRFFRPHARQRSTDYYCRGVVAVCEIPRSMMRPTQDKQGFQGETEFKNVKNRITACIEQYWDDVGFSSKRKIEIDEFWASYGYKDNAPFTDLPSQSENFVKKRNTDAGNFFRCVSCSKWRRIPSPTFSATNFKCSDFPNTVYKTCQIAEETFTFPAGKMPTKRAGAPQNAIAQSGWQPANSQPKPDKLAQFRQQQRMESALLHPEKQSCSNGESTAEIIDLDSVTNNDDQLFGALPSSTKAKTSYDFRQREMGEMFVEEDDEEPASSSKRKSARATRSSAAARDPGYAPGQSGAHAHSAKRKRANASGDDDKDSSHSDDEDAFRSISVKKSRLKQSAESGDSDVPVTKRKSDSIERDLFLLSSNLRDLLVGLAPENFKVNRTTIKKMKIEDLCKFPVKDFISALTEEKEALRRDAEIALEMQQNAADNANRELKQLRRNVANYLRLTDAKPTETIPTDQIETNSLDRALESLCDRARAAKANNDLSDANNDR